MPLCDGMWNNCGTVEQIPAGTEHKARLVLRGRGLIPANVSTKGNHILSLNVRTSTAGVETGVEEMEYKRRRKTKIATDLRA